jgi:ADP-ribose pyrophosphatase YjhB (NUDIX family)
MKRKVKLFPRIFLINKLFQKNKYYHYIKSPDVAITLPVLKNNKFILVCQKREPINKKNYEFPSGWVDEKEKPENSASRELLEETGYKSLMIPRKLLTIYPDPGRLSNKMICYFTNKILRVKKPEKSIKIIYCDKTKIVELVKKNQFNNASHIAAFYHYLSKRAQK